MDINHFVAIALPLLFAFWMWRLWDSYDSGLIVLTIPLSVISMVMLSSIAWGFGLVDFTAWK